MDVSRRKFMGGCIVGIVGTNLAGVRTLFGASPAPRTMPGTLNIRIAELAVAEGAAFLGAASMTDVYPRLAKVMGRPLPPTASALPMALSIGVALSDEIVERLQNDMPVYTRHFYGEMWPKAKVVGRKIGELLKQEGHRIAYGLEGVDGLPKMAARLAGLGWIGRSALLITPEMGPRVAWEVLLTDAPLTMDTKTDGIHCGDCRRCVDICPARAITGAEFKEADPLAARFLADRCERHRQSYGDIFTAGGCGLCVKVCPYGTRKDILYVSPARSVLAATPAAAAPVVDEPVTLTEGLAAGSQPAAIPLAKTDRSISDLESELRAVAEKAGADLVGIADMSPTYATWAAMSGKPVTAADAWPRAISIGVTMDDKIVDGIPKITPEYGGYFYGQAWPTAKRARSAISDWLKNQGFAAAAASKTLPGGGCKIAARYSGLAWIGKSCLAVTPQSGPRVAWEAVFTDAPLTPSARKPRDRECGDCQRCVDVCPAKAYTGIPFDEKDPPAKRYDTGKCSGYRGKLGNMFTIGACALCLEICPYGKRSDILLSGKPVVPVTPAAFPAPVNTLSK